MQVNKDSAKKLFESLNLEKKFERGIACLRLREKKNGSKNGQLTAIVSHGRTNSR